MLDQRSETRILCADLVDLRWKDPSGANRRVVANLEDISLSGACLQVERPVPLGVRIRIAYPKGNLAGTVQYCIFRETGYFLGVQFDADCRWSPYQYRPQHMLDPRRLVRDTLKRIKRSGETFVN